MNDCCLNELVQQAALSERGDERIWLQIGSSTKRYETINFGGQEVKGQEGHTTPKLDLEAWRRHHSRPLRSSRFFYCQVQLLLTVIDADGELEQGQNRNLSAYHLVHTSTVMVVMRLKGGSARLTPLPGLISVTYDQPDMITLDASSSEPKAIMPCNHVIS